MLLGKKRRAIVSFIDVAAGRIAILRVGLIEMVPGGVLRQSVDDLAETGGGDVARSFASRDEMRRNESKHLTLALRSFLYHRAPARINIFYFFGG
jgi:hypothetical protein